VDLKGTRIQVFIIGCFAHRPKKEKLNPNPSPFTRIVVTMIAALTLFLPPVLSFSLM
jgi:hypothetical protein